MKKSSRLYVERCISCLRGMSQIYFRNNFFLLKKRNLLYKYLAYQPKKPLQSAGIEQQNVKPKSSKEKVFNILEKNQYYLILSNICIYLMYFIYLCISFSIVCFT